MKKFISNDWRVLRHASMNSFPETYRTSFSRFGNTIGIRTRIKNILIEVNDVNENEIFI